MLEFEDPAVERLYAARHAASHASYDACAAIMGLVTGVIALIRMVARSSAYPAWVTAWAAASTAKNVAVLTALVAARGAWLARRDVVVTALRLEDQVMALVGSAHVLGPMEIVPHASATRVFVLTCACFGSQWVYLIFFAVGHPLRARTSAPITFALLLLLVAAAPFNYDRLARVRGGAINANPYVVGLARGAAAAARAVGVAPLLGGGTGAVTPKQAVVTAWWGMLMTSFWLLITIQRRAEASDRAAFAADVARASAGASSSSSAAPPPPPPAIKDTFAPCAWLFCVCPLLLMADIVAAGGLDVKKIG